MFTAIQTHTHYLDPMKAEVRVEVMWEGNSHAEVRGRGLGPKCPGTTTIEVAYPLHTLVSEPGRYSLAAIIPEPSLWEAATPFHYAVIVELWDNKKMLGRTNKTHELRKAVIS